MEIDWSGLRAAAIEAMRHAYAPYSDFPVGVAGLVDDGRVVVGCNVENASYGVGLCAECGLVSSLHATGGGRLVAISCVDANGNPLMPCGRCRQLLWENGGPECLVEALPRPLKMAELLPHAFGFDDLEKVTGAAAGHDVPPGLAKWRGRGTVFVHPDLAGGETVWTAYWERSGGTDADKGVLEEGPNFPTTAQAVSWGLVRTPQIVVVDADGGLSWAGETEPPEGIPDRWRQD
jgi:cytidine deaminase